jgi:hypothetical protein
MWRADFRPLIVVCASRSGPEDQKHNTQEMFYPYLTVSRLTVACGFPTPISGAVY